MQLVETDEQPELIVMLTVRFRKFYERGRIALQSRSALPQLRLYYQEIVVIIAADMSHDVWIRVWRCRSGW